MSFIGNQPWGWLPYHYGGWICDPIYGWLWTPGAFGFGNPRWSPVTGVWLHSRTGPIGIVPVHPLDVRGKTPVNLTKGVFAVSGGAISRATPLAAGQEWKVVKNVPKNTLSTNSVAAARPERVSRTLAAGTLGRVATMDRNSGIAYDAREHRFVNANGGSHQGAAANAAQPATGKSAGGVVAPTTDSVRATGGIPVNARASTAPAPVRDSLPSRTMVSPPAPHSTGMGRTGSGGGSVYQSSSSSRSSAPASTAASHASSGGSSSASSGSSSGGRPH
jgi:hypothetical protein